MKQLDISALYGHVVYNNELHDHSSTTVENRPEAVEFQQFLKENYGIGGKSVLVLDVHRAEAIRESGTTSSINPQLAKAGDKILRELVG